MIITVREALQLPALKDATLVAGEKGLSRAITSVNIMEVPDIARFVKEDEFLVTTTYPIKDDVGAQERLIPLLVEKGVAALAIKPVFYGNRIPEVMIHQANKLGFPLIQLPRNASFNEVINPILGEILNRQAIILRRNDEVHRAFTDIVLQGGSLKDIANLLSELQRAPVSIHTSRFHLLASAIPEDRQYHQGIFEHLGALSEDLGNAIAKRLGCICIEINGKEFDTHVQPVPVAGEDYAYLIVWLEQNAHYETNVVEQAATVIALEIVKMRSIAETERRFRSNFIEEILQGRINSKTDVLSRGEQYGWDLSQKYTPVVIEIVDHGDLLTVARDQEDFLKAVRRLWTAVLHVTADSSRIITVDIGARILLLIRADGSGDSEAFIQKLIHRIQEDMSPDKRTIGAGIGRTLKDIMDLKKGFDQALKALEIGQLVSGKGAITHYDELGVYRVLSIYGSHPETVKFSQELLGVLSKSDQFNNTDYINTLDSFLQSNCNLREASLKLYIHYNTLRYRLSKIEEITGVDLNSSEDRLSFQLALRIMRLHQSGTS